MNKTPEQYAHNLIQDYYNIDVESGYYNQVTWKMAIQCAIIDVKNTIEAMLSYDVFFPHAINE